MLYLYDLYIEANVLFVSLFKIFCRQAAENTLSKSDSRSRHRNIRDYLGGDRSSSYLPDRHILLIQDH